MSLLTALKAALGPKGLVWARCLSRGLPIPRWGNFRRVRPFSSIYGFDRGRPVDRHYVDNFLARHRRAISGDVLEVQSPHHAHRFGGELRRVDTVDLNPAFAPTYCIDLADAASVIPTG